jgi:putative ABC transport system substrate-binding protein
MLRSALRFIARGASRPLDRRAFLAALAATAARPAVAQTRQRIGWLLFGSTPGPLEQTLIDELARRGFADGQRVEIDFRSAGGSVARLGGAAAELTARSPRVLVALGGDLVATLRASTESIPIVAGVSDDPVRAGYAVSLAHPGRNFTGVTFVTAEMAGKRLELLREAAPQIRRIAVIWNPQHLEDEMDHVRASAGTLGLELISYEIGGRDAAESALTSAAQSGAQALCIIPSRLTIELRARFAEVARERNWPIIAAWREFTEAGGLLSYGPDRVEQARQLATYVERVLGGTAPRDLPIATPTRFELVVNVKTARAIGLALPTALVDRADTVIE